MARILHVLPGPRAEGTPRLVLDWINAGVHEHELLFLNSEGELKKEFLGKNVWQYYNERFVVRFVAAPKIIRLVRDVCRKRKPDIVISWPMGFSQWIHIGARLAGIKKLIVHSGNPPGKKFVGRYLYTYLSFWIGYLLGSKVITCSDYIRNEFSTIPLLSRKQFIRIYNCMNAARFDVRGVARDPNLAVMVATMETHKDHSTLLKAWKLLESEGYKFKLILAGGGTLEEQLMEQAMSLSLTNVQFAGSHQNIPVLLNQSSLFILSTTDQEGFGTVLLEALASGCRVVATDVPSCREVLRDGKYGILVPPADENALKGAIVEIMSNKETYSINEQLQYVKKFSPEEMMKGYIAIAG